MNIIANILAERDTGWIEIIVIAIVFGLSIIGSAIQKLKEKKEREEKARGDSKPPNRRQIRAPARRTVQPTRPAPPPTPAAPPPGKTVRVAEEMRLLKQRQAEIERNRQKRLASQISPESDADVIEADLVTVDSYQGKIPGERISKVADIPGLRTLADVRKAIILHEIFSPPKALRKGGEMWDS